MLHRRTSLLRSFQLALVTSCVLGCGARPRPVPLPLEPPPVFSSAGDAETPEEWWTTFGDGALNAAVDSALAANLGLKTAWQRLRAARAVLDRETSNLWPAIDLFARGEARDGSNAFVESDDFELGLAAEYEVDLWGRIRSSVHAEEFRARATRADYQAAALSLSAEIVSTWYELIEARGQVALIQEQIQTNETVLDLLEVRFGTGQIRSVDILRQRQLVAATREQRSDSEARVAVLEHALAVLLGRAPGVDLEVSRENLPQLPPLPATGVPIDLVRRRPDVQSAFHRLQAADRDLAAAVRNQYPRLSLSASAATVTGEAATLFQDWISALVGNLIAPIFRGGELRAEVGRSEAVRLQRLYEYGETILVAFQEVEDALILENRQIESIRSVERQLELAQQAYQQLRLQYFSGTANYLDVLTELDEIQQLQRRLLSSRRTLLEYRIALYRALAGSLRTTRDESETP